MLLVAVNLLFLYFFKIKSLLRNNFHSTFADYLRDEASGTNPIFYPLATIKVTE